MVNRRFKEAEQRRNDRLDRADAAGKLKARVPDLLTLDIQITEHRQSTTETTYMRRFVVDHAPALILVPCSDSRCTEGGYDITREVLRALDQHLDHFSGDGSCGGQLRTGPCTREMRYQGVATYAPIVDRVDAR